MIDRANPADHAPGPDGGHQPRLVVLRARAEQRCRPQADATQRRAAPGGKGCWRYNVFIERVWRSIEHEEVYLHAFETVSAARQGIGSYINFYNTRRPHSSHQARTPDVVRPRRSTYKSLKPVQINEARSDSHCLRPKSVPSRCRRRKPTSQ